jgi:hypothetical protein
MNLEYHIWFPYLLFCWCLSQTSNPRWKLALRYKMYPCCSGMRFLSTFFFVQCPRYEVGTLYFLCYYLPFTLIENTSMPYMVSNIALKSGISIIIDEFWMNVGGSRCTLFIGCLLCSLSEVHLPHFIHSRVIILAPFHKVLICLELPNIYSSRYAIWWYSQHSS